MYLVKGEKKLQGGQKQLESMIAKTECVAGYIGEGDRR